MPSLIPSAVVSTFDGKVVTTVQPHGFLTGTVIHVTGSSFDGKYVVNKLSSTSFSLRDQKTGASINGNSGAGGTVTPQLIAWPNIAFDPVMDIPWQKVNVVFAAPSEPTAGSDFYRETGYLQVTLYYPLLQGDGPAVSRAQLIRDTFKKGTSVVKDNVTVQFSNVAQILEGVTTDESYIVIVKVPFYANIHL